MVGSLSKIWLVKKKRLSQGRCAQLLQEGLPLSGLGDNSSFEDFPVHFVVLVKDIVQQRRRHIRMSGGIGNGAWMDLKINPFGTYSNCGK